MRAKRSLGQNFLKNIGIAHKMVSLAAVSAEDTVVEIGPGRGMLTRVLLDHARCVIAVEKDDALHEHLQIALHDRQGLRLLHQDILESDLSRLIPDGAKVVANLPYNIATPLLTRLVEHASRIAAVVVMLQKEVAQRICAKPGEHDYSALSVLICAGFDASPGFIVDPANFSPRPRVVSQVIRLIPKAVPIPLEDLGLFRTVVTCAFGQRRKVLRNSLSHLSGMDRDLLQRLASETPLDLGARPQDITPEVFRLFSRRYGEARILPPPA